MRTLILSLVFASCCFANTVETIVRDDKNRTLYVETQPAQTKMGIILIGDTGAINAHKDKVAKAIQTFCATELCSFALLLGDNFYERGVSSLDDPQFMTKFEQPYQNLNFAFFPVLGNHDTMGNWQYEVEYKSARWIMPDRYYTIDSELCNIYALDTDMHILKNSAPIDAEQFQWLDESLAAAKRPWKIVYGHHQLYSSGWYGNNLPMIDVLQPLLKKYAVDFYICGHEHDKELIEAEGIKYIISGTGSKKRNINPSDKSIFAASTFGFAHLLLTKNTAILRFVDEDGKVEFTREFKR